jgi:microcystin-dependent protein
MSLPNWNSDASSNKITNTYFRGYVDVSGGDVILRNGKVRSVNNTIEFDDVYYYINIPNNFHVLGNMKLLYNSIDYDVGERLACIGDIYDNRIGTMSYYAPSDFSLFNNIYCNGQIQYQESGTGNHVDLIPIILTNTSDITTAKGNITTLQGKTTNISFDSGTNTTTIGGLLTLPAGTINSTSINNTSFVDLTNGQTIGGIKRFTANVRVDSAILVNAGATSISNTVLGYISTLSSNAQTQLSGLNNRITAVETKTTPITYTALTTTTLITGIIQWTGTLNGWSTTNFSNAINYAKDLTSSAQAQINTINANSVLLANNNTFTGLNTFNGTTTTVANTLGSSIFTFSTSINGATKAVFDNVMLYCNSLTSNAQAQLTNLATKLTAISYEGSTTTTTIAGDIIFLNNLNSISATTFGYLSGLTSAIQSQLNSLSTRIATFELVGTIIMSPLSDLHTTSGNKYLHCTGQIVSRTTYSGLFAKIGTNFGAGDGSTTFAVPNYQGLFFRGMGGQLVNGTTYTGIAVNSIQQDSVQDHQHSPQNGAYLGTTTSASNSGGYLNSPLQRPNQYNFDNTGTMVSGRTNSVETRPVNVGIYYYIKT